MCEYQKKEMRWTPILRSSPWTEYWIGYVWRTLALIYNGPFPFVVPWWTKRFACTMPLPGKEPDDTTYTSERHDLGLVCVSFCGHVVENRRRCWVLAKSLLRLDAKCRFDSWIGVWSHFLLLVSDTLSFLTKKSLHISLVSWLFNIGLQIRVPPLAMIFKI